MSENEEKSEVKQSEQEAETENEEPKKAQPIGEVIRVSGEGELIRSHYDSFEYDGKIYNLEDSVLLNLQEITQKLENNARLVSGELEPSQILDTSPNVASGSQPQTSMTLREETTGDKQGNLNALSMLKLEYTKDIAIWASLEAKNPPLAALYGQQLAASYEALDIPPDPSLFSCERCETIIEPGQNCTAEKIKAKTRLRCKKMKISTQNDVVYRCHFCSHQNILTGTPEGYMKHICPPKAKWPSNSNPTKSDVASTRIEAEGVKNMVVISEDEDEVPLASCRSVGEDDQRKVRPDDKDEFGPCLSHIKILILRLIFNHTFFNKIIFSITSITFLSFSTTHSPSIYYSKIHFSKIIWLKHTLEVEEKLLENKKQKNKDPELEVESQNEEEEEAALVIPPDYIFFYFVKDMNLSLNLFRIVQFRLRKTGKREDIGTRKQRFSQKNNVVYTCHVCSHRNIERGTPEGYMKEICPPKAKRPSNSNLAKSDVASSSIEANGGENTEDLVLLVPEYTENQNQKPYVVIIKDIYQTRKGAMMVTGQWFCHPEEVEKGGGNWELHDTRELFYSFHRDEVPAESVMHKCVVPFIPLNKQ